MSLSLTQFTRSLKVYPSNYDIPSPYVLTTGYQEETPDCGELGCILSSEAQFQTRGVSVGDIVYVFDGVTFAFVTVVSALGENSYVWTADSINYGNTFIIYQQSALSGLGNQGCFLMSTLDNITINVETLSGDSIPSAILSANDVFPIQVRKLFSNTNNEAIYALW